jgi:hypothetical protein
VTHGVRRFDGCYHSYDLHDFADDDPPNFRTFAEAARAGNPDAALAFNPGQVPWLPSLSAHQDFTAGEIGIAEQLPSPSGRRFSNLNAQYHILSYLGPVWGCFGVSANATACVPRFDDSTLSGIVSAYSAHGWPTTWDTPIHDNGTLYAAFVPQLRKLKPYGRPARGLKSDDGRRGAETLYNGIVLPALWPPRIKLTARTSLAEPWCASTEEPALRPELHSALWSSRIAVCIVCASRLRS